MTANQIGMLLFDLAAILLVARLVGVAARRFGQPAVIGEIIAGILLGPSVFGTAFTRVVFPLDVRPALTAVANVGLAIFMFIVGLDLDGGSARRGLKAAMLVSVGATVLPFGLGTAFAHGVLLRYDPSHKPLAFIVFLGAAMSITSFPVMARILTDLRMERTPLGVLALTSAAVSDVIAWVMLAVATALANGGRNGWIALFLIPYAAVMFFVVRPLLRRLVGRTSGGEALAILLGGLLLSGVVTQWLGLNYIFGAFLFGACVPAEGTGQLRREVNEQLGGLCILLLLPVFFVVTGLQVDLSHVGLGGIGLLLAILAVAASSKYAGGFTAARLLGTDTRRSAALATLMNTRGVTELVVLSIGLQMGVLDHELYSYMVVMTVITTAMAGPILRAIYPRRRIDLDLAAAAPPEGELVAAAPTGEGR